MEDNRKIIGHHTVDEWFIILNSIMYDSDCGENDFLGTTNNYEIELIKEEKTCQVLSDIFYKKPKWALRFFLVLKTRKQYIIDIFIFNEYGWEVFDYIWKSPISNLDRLEIIKEIGVLNFTSTSVTSNENFELICYIVEFDKYLGSKINWAHQYGIKVSQ